MRKSGFANVYVLCKYEVQASVHSENRCNLTIAIEKMALARTLGMEFLGPHGPNHVLGIKLQRQPFC